MKLCLVVLICVYQHESACVGKMETKLSLRPLLITNETKSISLKPGRVEFVFIILNTFRSWRVVVDTVGRCVTGQRLPRNGTHTHTHTQNTHGWVLAEGSFENTPELNA